MLDLIFHYYLLTKYFYLIPLVCLICTNSNSCVKITYSQWQKKMLKKWNDCDYNRRFRYYVKTRNYAIIRNGTLPCCRCDEQKKEVSGGRRVVCPNQLQKVDVSGGGRVHHHLSYHRVFHKFLSYQLFVPLTCIVCPTAPQGKSIICPAVDICFTQHEYVLVFKNLLIFFDSARGLTKCACSSRTARTKAEIISIMEL